MNLDVALALCRQGAEEAIAASQMKPEMGYHYALPEELHVGTDDGRSFYLFYIISPFEEECCESVRIHTPEEWAEKSREWRRFYLEPDGVWHHRRIARFRNEQGSWPVDLDCGHHNAIRHIHLTPRPGPMNLGEVVTCLECLECLEEAG